MATGTVGSETFTKVEVRRFARPGKPARDVSRPNVQGVAVRVSAERGGNVEITAMRTLTNAAGSKTKIDAYFALKGTTITVTDSAGRAWTNITIIGVEVEYDAPCGTNAGGGIDDAYGDLTGDGRKLRMYFLGLDGNVS